MRWQLTYSSTVFVCHTKYAYRTHTHARMQAIPSNQPHRYLTVISIPLPLPLIIFASSSSRPPPDLIDHLTWCMRYQYLQSINPVRPSIHRTHPTVSQSIRLLSPVFPQSFPRFPQTDYSYLTSLDLSQSLVSPKDIALQDGFSERNWCCPPPPTDPLHRHSQLPDCWLWSRYPRRTHLPARVLRTVPGNTDYWSQSWTREGPQLPDPRYRDGSFLLGVGLPAPALPVAKTYSS